MELYFDNRQSKFDITKEMEDLLGRVVEEAFKVEGISDEYEVSISFVDNDEIRELNREYRGVDSETDVLSFPIDDDFLIPTPLLGDIIISLEKAKEQAEEFGHTLDRELAYLTAHSMFHLFGYDHINNDDKSIMRDKEKIVMRNLGVFKGKESYE